jgi:hypothetical protein
MVTKASSGRKPPAKNRPEKKISAGGLTAAVWLNEIQTENGPRPVRSVTLSPRRYRDRETGAWKDAASYRPGDLPALIFVLEKTLEFLYTAPLPGREPGGDGQEEPPY